MCLHYMMCLWSLPHLQCNARVSALIHTAHFPTTYHIRLDTKECTIQLASMLPNTGRPTNVYMNKIRGRNDALLRCTHSAYNVPRFPTHPCRIANVHMVLVLWEQGKMGSKPFPQLSINVSRATPCFFILHYNHIVDILFFRIQCQANSAIWCPPIHHARLIAEGTTTGFYDTFDLALVYYIVRTLESTAIVNAIKGMLA